METIVIVASRYHPTAALTKMEIHNLDGESIILPRHDCSYKMLFEKIVTEKSIVEPIPYHYQNEWVLPLMWFLCGITGFSKACLTAWKSVVLITEKGGKLLSLTDHEIFIC